MGWTRTSVGQLIENILLWMSMGARLWKCSREGVRLATDDEGIAAEVTAALSQELLDDVFSGKSARYLNVKEDTGEVLVGTEGGVFMSRTMKRKPFDNRRSASEVKHMYGTP